MDCPQCGLVNPPESTHCGCGYEFNSRQPDATALSSDAQSQEAVCPYCGATAEPGCLMGKRQPLRWFAGPPSVRKKLLLNFGAGVRVGEWSPFSWTAPYVEGIRCVSCRRIILSY
jgi:hypothetical protein